MFRKMRRFKQLLPESETREIIARANTGILGVNGDDGYPYAVPVNHVLVDDKIYFHSAKAGHKVDSIKNNPKVSFTIVDKDDVVSREYTTYFRSGMVFGKARIAEGEERKNAFRLLCERFCADDLDRYDEIMEKEEAAALIICIDIEHMTGKEAMELVKQR